MSETMRIAVIAPPWYRVPPGAYGGIELMVFWLVQGLVERGHEVTLVGADEDTTRARFFSTYSTAPSERVGDPFPEVVQAAYAGVVLRGLDHDIVHDNSLAGPLLGFNRPQPTVVTAHGPIDGDVVKYYELLSDCAELVAISNHQMELAPDLNWAGTVYNAIPVEEYPYSEDKDDYLLFLGRLNPEKAPHLAIDAARRAGARLVLAGKCSEPSEQEYFEREINPRLDNDVEWIGEADMKRKKELFLHARATLFPIQWDEPFGLVMVESMACGTPVVAMSKGSAPEVVTNDVTGFVRDDLDSFVDAIGSVKEIDPKECRKDVEERFSIRAMVDGYEAIFKKELEASRS